MYKVMLLSLAESSLKINQTSLMQLLPTSCRAAIKMIIRVKPRHIHKHSHLQSLVKKRHGNVFLWTHLQLLTFPT